MIVAALKGGLGNQLFQFAASYALAKDKSVSVGVDISSFDSNKLRKPLLLNLNIKPDKILTEPVHRNIFTRVSDKILPYYKKSIYREQSLAYDSNLSAARKHVILEGYFQSEKYFLHHAAEIKRWIIINENRNYSVYENLIKNNLTIGVHVRRGDYLFKKNISTHGVCSMDYYRSAIEYVIQKIGNAIIVFFSDDIAWCKTNFDWLPKTIFVEAVEPDSVYEVKLLSMCSCQIISNSTFGWWGAWFNLEANKIVVAPKRWFVNDLRQNQIQDLYPDTWIKL